ncbi:MAG: carboxymuconolactone decarboxylase family protein [Clostridia bacterium]|jgi:AhpD family alkylhydroperoxidase
MGDDVLYRRSYGERFPEMRSHAPEAFDAYVAWDQAAFKDGALSRKTKELIAVAVAHVTGCPYCIEAHVGHVKRLGGTKAEVLEAVQIAGVLKAGSALAHGVNALNAFDRE